MNLMPTAWHDDGSLDEKMVVSSQGLTREPFIRLFDPSAIHIGHLTILHSLTVDVQAAFPFVFLNR
jgi:hypothetical protein